MLEHATSAYKEPMFYGLEAKERAEGLAMKEESKAAEYRRIADACIRGRETDVPKE
jgi:hypothetical protein